MGVTILSVKDEKELQRLYQYRYKIYIQELDRVQKWADHNLKKIQEPLDAHSDNFIAYNGNEIVGSLRYTICDRHNKSSYYDFYNLELFESFSPENNTSFVTKLMVSPKQRGLLGLRLTIEAFKHGSELTNFSVLDCYEPLIPFFLKLGYRFYTDKKVHPEFGLVTPMVILTKDTEYLKKIRSPFSRYPPKNMERHHESIQFFNENFKHIHDRMHEEHVMSNVEY